jgi:hypothetical protein
MNTRAPLTLRLNPLKITPGEVSFIFTEVSEDP